jgi:hypothetical protein
MADKSVIAYFKTRDDAEAAAAKLHAIRALDVSVDSFARYPGEAVVGPVSPVTGNITSLAALTMDASVDTRETGVLMSADTNASGMSDGGQGGTSGYNYVLSAVVRPETHHLALRVVEETGGRI